MKVQSVLACVSHSVAMTWVKRGDQPSKLCTHTVESCGKVEYNKYLIHSIPKKMRLATQPSAVTMLGRKYKQIGSSYKR